MSLSTSTRGLVPVLVLALAGCAYTPLLENLDERQANEVVAVLLHNNIGAEKRNVGKAGYVVDVDADDLAESIDLMQYHSLPSTPRGQVGQAFPADALVSTPLAERARLISAVELRLEESLLQIQGVRSTRVHLNYDVNLGGDGRRPDGRKMHVAAVIGHDADADAEVLLQSIKRFLRNTFDGIDYDNVSVILTPVKGPRVLAVTKGETSLPPLGWLALVASVLLILVAGVALLARSIPALGRRLAQWRARMPAVRGGRWRAER